jgi:hypothetical protein
LIFYSSLQSTFAELANSGIALDINTNNVQFNYMKTKLTLAGAMMAAIWISGCSGKKEQKNGPDTLAVNVFNLSADSVSASDRIVYDGTLEAEKTIDLSFQVSGTILSFRC